MCKVVVPIHSFILLFLFYHVYHFYFSFPFNFCIHSAVEKCLADSTTSSDSDATISYESDSKHEPYFFEDETSDDRDDQQVIIVICICERKTIKKCIVITICLPMSISFYFMFSSFPI